MSPRSHEIESAINVSRKLQLYVSMDVGIDTAGLHHLCFLLAWARKHAICGGNASFCENIGGIDNYMLLFQCVRLL